MRNCLMLALLSAILLASSAKSSEIVELCLAKFNWSQAMCQCLADKARDELDDNQQNFVVASLAGDTTTAGELRNSMSIQEITQATMFQVSAPQACAAAQ